jgi:cytochrome c
MKPCSTAWRALGPLALLAVLATSAAGITATPAVGTSATRDGDALRGARLYDSRCTGCHALDSNRVGPLHRGVFGRRAGGVAGYAYSPALANADLTWNEATLDRWLSNPQALLPGQRMNLRVKDAQDRADIIAFLRQVSRESAE